MTDSGPFEPENSGQAVAVFAPDLADRSRFDRFAVTHIRRPEQLEALELRLILVDLDRCPDPMAFLRAGVHSVGFCSHVDTARQEQASAGGFAEVLARSAFFRRLPELLGQAEPPQPRTASPNGDDS